MKNYIWVVEMQNDVSLKFEPTVRVGLTREAGRRVSVSLVCISSTLTFNSESNSSCPSYRSVIDFSFSTIVSCCLHGVLGVIFFPLFAIIRPSKILLCRKHSVFLQFFNRHFLQLRLNQFAGFVLFHSNNRFAF